jgi:hypothetical protein
MVVLWPWLKCVLSDGDNAARTASGEVLLHCVIVQQNDNTHSERTLLLLLPKDGTTKRAHRVQLKAKDK